MRKNISGQTIGVQMTDATSGAAFTAAVSVLVTGDAGTQTAGGGVVTHEGNGYHSYAPTQAETNYTHVAFTFTGSGAIATTVQVYTELSAAGTGAIEWDYTLTNANTGLPIADADVWVTSDAAGTNFLASGTTNQSGVVTFFLDAGQVYVWRQRSGFNFTNPDSETVTA